MAKLGMNVAKLQQVRRRVSWGIRRTVRNAFRYPNRLTTVRIFLLVLVLALGLSVLLAERCLVLRNQVDLTEVSDSVRTLAVPSDSENPINFTLMPADTIPEVLGRFDSVAREFSLRIERIDYRKEVAFAESGDILRINTTLIGNAERIVAMSASLLQIFPGLSLAALKMIRDRIESPDGEVQITWILFLKPTDLEKGKR